MQVAQSGHQLSQARTRIDIASITRELSQLPTGGRPHGANDTQDVIARLLTNIGSRKEVEQYLRNYASVDAPKFQLQRDGYAAAITDPRVIEVYLGR